MLMLIKLFYLSVFSASLSAEDLHKSAVQKQWRQELDT